MGRAAFLGVLIAAMAAPAAILGEAPPVPANQLVRKVIAHEVAAERADNSYWMFRLQVTKPDTGPRLEEVVETPHGWVRRLLGQNGHPLTAAQQSKENQRLQHFLKDADEQRKNEQETRQDVQQAQDLLKILPDAFLYSYAGPPSGTVVKLNFKPNPNFDPPSRQAAVFHDMVGSLWLNVKAGRLAGIQGQLMKEVKFAAGLLGHLDKGGQFQVKQSQIAPGIWDVTYMNVQMQGKALFFKTIAVHEKDVRTDYHRIPSNLTLAQAVNLVEHPGERSQAARLSRGIRARRLPTKALASRKAKRAV